MDETLAPVTRSDFERFAVEMRKEVAAAVAASAAPGRHDVLSDVLGQLRIIKWGAGFALAAIMGAFGILYQGQVDLRAEMRGEIAGLRMEMRSEIAALREEMHREFAVLRREIASLGERVARLEAGHGFILARLDDLVARVRALEASRDEEAANAPAVDQGRNGGPARPS